MMLLVAAFLLGMAFASAGLIAKDINRGPGTQISDRRIHMRLTTLGALSNLVLPAVAVVPAAIVQGIGGAGLAAFGLISGAFILGLLRLPYPIRMMLTLFGLPVMGLLFLVVLLW